MSIKAPLLLALPPTATEPARPGLPALDTGAAEAREQQAARSVQLEQLALEHARCEDAAAACYYLCRSLGAARQLEPGEQGLELLFELLGALADLPLPAAEAQPAEAQGEADGLGVFELCQQLQSAREQSQQAWREIAEPDEACGPALFLH